MRATRRLNAAAEPLLLNSTTHTDPICAATLATCMRPEAKGANIGRRGRACGATPTANKAVRLHLSHTLPHSPTASDRLRSVGNDPTTPHGIAL